MLMILLMETSHITAFGLLPFTASDPCEAFITVLQHIPEISMNFSSMLIREGQQKLCIGLMSLQIACQKI